MAEIIEEDAARVCGAVDLAPLDGGSVLLTGASGLLGLHLLAALRQRGRQTGRPIHVTAIARSTPPAAFANFFDDLNIRLQAMDLADSDAIRALPQHDHIIHAAGYGQPHRFLSDPINTIRLNTVATLALLEKLPATGKFLFMSSSEIYSGAPSPHTEADIGTTDPGHVRACYIEGKRCGETICRGFRAQGRAVKAARLALAYGPGTRIDDQRVLNTLIRRALLERRVTLLDQGQARRTYGYVTDIVEMLFSILLYGREPVYNVGGRSATTIAELARTIADVAGVPMTAPAQDRALPGAPGDVALDLSLVCGEFGKRDFVPLREGLERTMAAYRALCGDGAGDRLEREAS
ncbi:MAG TPA: NAD-dependent epimerase/dehydratase family protein [Stellaceae bacterium]